MTVEFESPGLWLRARRASRRQPLLAFAVGFLVLEVVVALLAPVISPYNPTVPDSSSILTPPSSRHWLGTDVHGYDVLSQIMHAPRIDLLIAVTSTVVALLIGTGLGALAGYAAGRGGLGGAAGEVFTRAIDIVQAFPVFIVALAIVGVAGAGTRNVILVLSLLFTPIFFRFVRAEVLLTRELVFVEAERSIGNRPARLLAVHILPNSVTTALVQASGIIGYAILLTAGLSFVGAGVRPPTPEWGAMINAGAQQMITGKWWTALFPGIAMGLTVFSLAAVGESVRMRLSES